MVTIFENDLITRKIILRVIFSFIFTVNLLGTSQNWISHCNQWMWLPCHQSVKQLDNLFSTNSRVFFIQYKDRLSRVFNLIIEIRRSWDRSIIIMWIVILVWQHLYIEITPSSSDCQEIIKQRTYSYDKDPTRYLVGVIYACAERHIEAEMNGRRQFQNNFLEWKRLNFDQVSTECCSLESN